MTLLVLEILEPLPAEVLKPTFCTYIIRIECQDCQRPKVCQIIQVYEECKLSIQRQVFVGNKVIDDTFRDLTNGVSTLESVIKSVKVGMRF